MMEPVSLGQLARRLAPFRRIIAVPVVALSLYYVFSVLKEGINQASLTEINVNYAFLLLPLLLFTTCTLLGGAVWFLVLAGVGVKIEFRVAMKIHISSILPKYVPGYIWQFVGKAYLSGEAGAPQQLVVLGMGLEMLLLVSGGVIVAAVVLPVTPFAGWLFPPLPGLRVVAPLAGLALLLLLPKLVQLPQRQGLLAGRSNHSPVQGYFNTLAILGIIAIAWIVLGTSVFLIASSLHDVNSSAIPGFIFAFTASMLAGLFVFFAPVGLGIREGLLTLLLALFVPAPVAAMVAILSRILMTIGEVLSFAIVAKL